MMFTFESLRGLIMSAKDTKTIEEFLAEEGGALPSDKQYEDWKSEEILRVIYSMRDGIDIKAVREVSGKSRREFCAAYGIPVRTMESWELSGSQSRKSTEYMNTLLLCDVLNSRYLET